MYLQGHTYIKGSVLIFSVVLCHNGKNSEHVPMSGGSPHYGSLTMIDAENITMEVGFGKNIRVSNPFLVLQTVVIYTIVIKRFDF